MTTLTTNPIPQDQIPDAFSVQPDAKLLGRQNISGTPTTFEFDIALVLAYVAVNLDTTTAAELTTALLGYYAKGETIADTDIPATITRDTEVAAAVSAHVAAADPHPGYLTQTEGDVRYAPLGESPGSGARYLFDVSTVITGVGTGEIRFNNTTASLVTSITISELDRNSGAMATFLDLISAGSKLQISFDASEETYAWFNVTAIVDNGSFRTFTVTHIASAGTRANGEVTLGIFGSPGSTLTVREVDGTPSIAASVIEFPNGSLTDQGGGIARLAFPSGGASGLQYTYNNAEPPTASGQIRTLQASLNVATAVAIDAADSNGDSATDITARLKTGAIFTIVKEAANYVRFEATADYDSGSVAVVVRAEQGAIATGDTVYLTINSDAPIAVSGSGLTRLEATDSTVALTANSVVISNRATAQLLALPVNPGLSVNKVVGKGAGVWNVGAGAGIIYDPTGANNTGVRRLATHQYATVELENIGGNNWVITAPSDMTGIELYSASTYDIDAQAVITAIEATGVTLTISQKNACNSRVLAFKANGTWTSLNFYYGFLGGTANSHRINWRSPGTSDITWVGSPNHSAAGSAPVSASNYGDTNMLVSYAKFPSTGWALACYISVAATVNTALNWGQSASGNIVGLQKITGGNFGGLMFNSQINSGISVDPASKGFRLAQRKNSTLVNFLVDTTISADLSSAVAAEGTGTNMRIFGGGTFAQIQTYGSWASWNAPMTNAKLLQEQIDEVAYQTALSRN
jgi:hypothetical protein